MVTQKNLDDPPWVEQGRIHRSDRCAGPARVHRHFPGGEGWLGHLIENSRHQGVEA